MKIVYNTDTNDHGVIFVSYNALMDELKKKPFKNRKIIKRIYKEIESMKCMFYSELTDKFYPTAKECVAAENEFKAEQSKRSEEMERLKREAEAIAAKAEEEKRREECDKAFSECEKAFDEIASKVVDFLKLAKKFIGLMPEDETLFGLDLTDVIEYLDSIIDDCEHDESEEDE